MALRWRIHPRGLILKASLAGGFDNTFFRDNVTSAQILVTSPNITNDQAVRFIVATPAGNSGALLYFIPSSNSSGFTAIIEEASLNSVSAASNQAGVSGVVQLSSEASLGVAIVGGIRASKLVPFLEVLLSVY